MLKKLPIFIIIKVISLPKTSAGTPSIVVVLTEVAIRLMPIAIHGIVPPPIM
jgi:hypothetical protein